MIRTREVMTENIIAIRPSCALRDAVDLLLESEVSGLPVTDEEGRLVGIITEFAMLAIAYDNCLDNDCVAQHMTTEVLTVDVDDPIRKAADFCIVHRVRRVPVMEQGRLVGLISRRDVLRAVYEAGRSPTTTSSADA